jgi:hypothetical protein
VDLDVGPFLQPVIFSSCSAVVGWYGSSLWTCWQTDESKKSDIEC